MIYKRFTDKTAEEWRQIYKVSFARSQHVVETGFVNISSGGPG